MGRQVQTEYCLSPYQSSGEDPQGDRTPPLKNTNGDLTSFDMELLEARDAAQNLAFWRMLASYSTTPP